MRFRVASVFGGLPKQDFELCEDLFDWIEIWTVRRQEEELCAGGTDRAPHGFSLVASEIIDDDNIAESERRHEYLLDIGQEACSVDRTIDDTGGSDAITAQRSDEGQRPPTAMWSLRYQTLASRCTAVRARHIGLGPGLVDEDQASWINPPLILYPLRPTSSDVGTILLAGAQAFLKLIPSCSKKCHTA
jgi:hypothetical protein